MARKLKKGDVEKGMKTIIYLFGLFIMFWFIFFLSNIVKDIGGGSTAYDLVWIIGIFVALGFIGKLAGPRSKR